MGLFDPQPPAAALEAALDRERAALRGGRLDDLERLAEEKVRLAAALARDPATPDALERLRGKAARNAKLLAAARAGVTAAQERVAALRSGARLTTYTAAGESETLGTRAGTLHRRA